MLGPSTHTLGRAAEPEPPRRRSAVLCSRPDGRAKLSKWVVRWASLALAWIHSEHAALPKLLTSQEGAVGVPQPPPAWRNRTHSGFSWRHRTPAVSGCSVIDRCSHSRAWLGSAQVSITN